MKPQHILTKEDYELILACLKDRRIKNDDTIEMSLEEKHFTTITDSIIEEAEEENKEIDKLMKKIKHDIFRK